MHTASNMARDRVHDLLKAAFLRSENEVIKTQAFDASPGSMGSPYDRVAESAMAQSHCSRVLHGAERDAVIAYWTARGLTRELQERVAQGRAREMDPREQRLVGVKDAACCRLVTAVRDDLPGKHAGNEDLLLDLIREWAGIEGSGQSSRLADIHGLAPSTYREIRGGYKARRGRRGSPGVHGLLEDYYHRALDRLAGYVAPDEDAEALRYM